MASLFVPLAIGGVAAMTITAAGRHAPLVGTDVDTGDTGFIQSADDDQTNILNLIHQNPQLYAMRDKRPDRSRMKNLSRVNVNPIYWGPGVGVEGAGYLTQTSQKAYYTNPECNDNPVESVYLEGMVTDVAAERPPYQKTEEQLLAGVASGDTVAYDTFVNQLGNKTDGRVSLESRAHADASRNFTYIAG